MKTSVFIKKNGKITLIRARCRLQSLKIPLPIDDYKFEHITFFYNSRNGNNEELRLNLISSVIDKNKSLSFSTLPTMKYDYGKFELEHKNDLPTILRLSL